MPSSVDAQTVGRFGRRTVLVAALVSLFIAGSGTAYWFFHRFPAAPMPPVVPANPAEPEFTAVAQKLRGEVLREPRSARTWGRLGQALLANDWMESEAQVCFAEAQRLDPKNPHWPYYQAGILLNQGEREAALPYLQRAAAHCAVAAPDKTAPRLRLAETLLALGRRGEAEEQFRQVLGRNADDVRAHYGTALAAADRQEWQTSRKHLLRCLGSPLAQQKACVQLAFVSQCLGDTANAQKYRQQADRLPADQDWNDPYVTEYLVWAVTKRNRYRLAESLEASGRLREAASVVRPMVREYPDDYRAPYLLGKIVGQLGGSREAEIALRQALRLAPEKVQVHYYLGLVLFTQAVEAAEHGDRVRAEKLYQEAAERSREALTLKDDYGFAHMTLGLALKGLGKRAEALSALRQAVRCNPEHAELHFYLGDLLAEEGQNKEAREQLEQALEMVPPNAPWKSTAEARLAAVKK